MQCRGQGLLNEVKLLVQELGGQRGEGLISGEYGTIPTIGYQYIPVLTLLLHLVEPIPAHRVYLIHSSLLYDLYRGSLEFSVCMDLKNPWNDNKPVKISRDGQVSC